MKTKLIYFRTLFSQSAASVTMGSIAAYLRQNKHEADICLLERESNGLNNFKRIITKDEKFLVIAKPNFKDYQLMFPVLKNMKNRGIATKIFFCGPFATINADNMLKEIDWLDGIILGQPEQTALKLIKSLKAKGTWWEIPGGLWRSPKKNSSC